jgi:hypothetical protein
MGASPAAIAREIVVQMRRASSTPVVQRVEAEDIEGNVMSLTPGAGGDLDERSQRRVWERLAQLDPTVDAAAWDTMTPEQRRPALRAAITRFQESDQGSDLVDEVRDDNDVDDPRGGNLYDPPREGRQSQWTAPRAGYTEGEVDPNDATAQALANAWPQVILGRQMDEQQAYRLLSTMVQRRGLEWNAQGTNVIGLRGFQGGAMHDNDEEQIRTRQNEYNDTMFVVSMAGGAPRVRQSRATVDPGGNANAFQVGADQQWDYQGYAHGRSRKYDRAIYGMPEPSEVRRGRHWQEHPEEIPSEDSGSGRIVNRRGRNLFDRDTRGRGRMVSAVHSGGRGGGPDRDQVLGDSTGCSVVHGAWFANFNESLVRADQASTGNTDANPRVRFTYSLIEPSMFPAEELTQILDQVAPGGSGRPARQG